MACNPNELQRRFEESLTKKVEAYVKGFKATIIPSVPDAPDNILVDIELDYEEAIYIDTN